MAEASDSLQFVGAKVREHRIHLQNNREFGLFAHGFTFQIDFQTVPEGPSKFAPREVCHKSHKIAAALEYFWLLWAISPFRDKLACPAAPHLAPPKPMPIARPGKSK
jgi:hypothetical protein